ncbi:hypothetical protein ACLOJK_027747 [Asimina triloba]
MHPKVLNSARDPTSAAADQKWVSRCCKISNLKEADLLMSLVEPRWVSAVDVERQRHLRLRCQRAELLLSFNLGSTEVLLIGFVPPLLRFFPNIDDNAAVAERGDR